MSTHVFRVVRIKSVTANPEPGCKKLVLLIDDDSGEQLEWTTTRDFCIGETFDITIEAAVEGVAS